MLDTLPGWRSGPKAGTFFLLHIRMENGAKYKNLAVKPKSKHKVKNKWLKLCLCPVKVLVKYGFSFL